MINKRIILFFAIIVLSLLWTTSVFATQIATTDKTIQEKDKVVSRIDIVSMTKTADNKITFRYRIFNQYGLLITNEIPDSQLYAFLAGSSITLYPSTQSGTITIDSPSELAKSACLILADTITRVNTTMGISNELLGRAEEPVEPAVPLEDSLKIYQIVFTSNDLIKTGETTATFHYLVLNALGTDITKLTPNDQIIATTSVGTNIVLDPLTETGTITYEASDIDKATIITLSDKQTGLTAILNTGETEADQQTTEDALIVSRLYFSSVNLLKTGETTATFKYKLLDSYYRDITRKIPALDIVATALVGSSKAEVCLDPLTGSGTITYNFADTDKNVMVTLIHKTGVGASSTLTIYDSESELMNVIKNDDTSVGQIGFVLTDVLDGSGTTSQLSYYILNKSGKDITKKVPASQIALEASINSMLNIKPPTGTCYIDYDSLNTHKIAIVKLTDRITGVMASINIGDRETWKQKIPLEVNLIAFRSNDLIKISNDSAIFKYIIRSQSGAVITEAIPSSQISTTASLLASISFNPLAGIGTITYNSSSDLDKPIVITLADKVTDTRVSSTFNSSSSITPGVTPNLTVTPKISHITITSTKLAISSAGLGYATYNITDQFGNDITNSSLGKGVVFKIDGGGTVNARDGLLTITPENGANLNEQTSIVMTAYDSATGISTSATLIVVPMFS
ncbi:MAG: hypothetical protein APF81_11595 [Desulfosporosinus sp. BRH_c37]|nr:MAG: hypothetical protein APF81_11595 [Desulfosporosinus sp. BRH_c37]